MELLLNAKYLTILISSYQWNDSFYFFIRLFDQINKLFEIPNSQRNWTNNRFIEYNLKKIESYNPFSKRLRIMHFNFKVQTIFQFKRPSYKK